VVCLCIGLLALIVRAALLPLRPIPDPTVHDEFSYLLGADTFRLGRITNPPHHMWVHFETLHVNFQPTYASKYPPAQALLLAVGWKLLGHPWYGVWLSCGLMCAALCWMLQGWLPPRYALLGGLMAVAQWGITGNWVNSYMGGAVAAAAGALVIGAVPRLVRCLSADVAALGAFGVVVLANSRPYEGALTAAGAGVAVWIWRRRARRPLQKLVAWRVVAPGAAILLAGLAGVAYYNYRLTGDPFLMPHALHQRLYGIAPMFWMLPPAPEPVYHHEAIRRLWAEWDMSYYHLARSFPPRVLIPFVDMLGYFLTPISVMALFAAVCLRRSWKVGMALTILGCVTAGVLLEKFPLPHYFAPATGLVLVLVLLGAQYLRVKFGPRALVAFAVLFFAVTAIQASRLTKDEYPHKVFAANRSIVTHFLEGAGGRQLVIVRYAPKHDPIEEWVYNRADIDGSEIVWARDMGEARNRELLDYYRGRKVWLLETDKPAPAPVPYQPL
jgi:hypothetical protein